MSEPVDRPYFVDSAEGPLFVVETTPPEGAPHAAVVVCPGAWYGGSALNNQMLVHLAHRLAIDGFRVLRFDWHGCGESPGYVETFDLRSPRVGDVKAVVRAAQGPEQLPLYMVGICFGSLSILPAVVDNPDLRGLALVSLPLLEGAGARVKEQRARRVGVRQAVRVGLKPSVMRGWLDSSTRAFYLKWLKLRLAKTRTMPASETLDSLQALSLLLEKGARALLLFGEEDWRASSDEAERTGFFDQSPANAAGSVELRTIPGDLQGFPDVEVQMRTNQVIGDWLEQFVESSDSDDVDIQSRPRPRAQQT